MLLEHAVGGFEVAAVADHFRQPVVLDLRHVDRSVPCREQRRRPDRSADLVRQRVHVVAEDRARVGRGVEIVVPRGRAKLVLDLAQDGVAVGLEGIIARPDLIDDLDAGIPAVRMDADQPPARPQRLDQRRHDFGSLELVPAPGRAAKR
jgi:hypothetical protein